MKGTVLITGGTGLIGKHLTQLLSEEGYDVQYLSRNPKGVKGIKAFKWDIKRQEIDPEALVSADYIIHLAGAGVADERWTKERKGIILESRTQSTALLREALRSQAHNVKQVVSASAIGYYGFDTGNVWMKEEDQPGNDFLADVTKAWENEISLIEGLGVNCAQIRVGLVLAKEGGAMKKLLIPAKLGVNAPLGNGKQYMSWIHINDLCRMFIHIIKNNLSGPFNGVAPNPVTNKEFTKQISTAVNRPAFLPNVPAFALKLVLGEMANMLIGGNRCSSKKIEQTDFIYQFRELTPAFQDLLKK